MNLGLNAGSRHPGCGNSDSVQTWMDQIQNSGEQQPDQEPLLPAKDLKTEKEEIHFQLDPDDANAGPAYKYSKQGNTRSRRSTREPLPNPNVSKSCSLYIQTDPLFWKHIKEQEKDAAKIEEEI